MSVLIAIGAIIALTIVLAFLWYQSSTKLKVASIAAPADGGGALVITTAEGTTKDPAKLYGKKLVVYTQSLGRIYTSVCSITVPSIALTTGMVVTSSAGAFPPSATYAWDPSDYILISSV